jgi:diaminohydroxyphosphoribosylaminopyrimidine deaminase / 5-amino-6-(5-phosphoribosylamino)uracil reductase
VNARDDEQLLREAIELSRKAPPSQTAFSVGSVIAAPDGTVLVTSYSRERGAHRSSRAARGGAIRAHARNASLRRAFDA